MKTVTLAQVALFAIGTLFSNLASAADFYSYWNRPIPGNAYYGGNIISVANSHATVGFALSKLGQKVGAGGCTDLVETAIAYAGARRPDYTDYRNTIWGAVSTGVQLGDVVQFENCYFWWKVGNGYQDRISDHHTAIVLSCSNGVIQMIHQNAPLGGPVRIDTLDLSTKQRGTIKFWRPVMW